MHFSNKKYFTAYNLLNVDKYLSRLLIILFFHGPVNFDSVYFPLYLVLLYCVQRSKLFSVNSLFHVKWL